MLYFKMRQLEIIETLLIQVFQKKNILIIIHYARKAETCVKAPSIREDANLLKL